MSDKQAVQQGTDPKRCQVCGDRFGIWLGAPMTDGNCPMTKTREMCDGAKDRAHAEGMRRKVCPDAFDGAGKIKPGALIEVIDAMHAAGLDPWTGRPA